MIRERLVKTYCCEDISLIENYEQAINDKDHTWHCHHRLEIQGDNVLTMNNLKKLDLYLNRPANELIFLTASEHHKLHSNHFTDEMIENMSKPKKNKFKTIKYDRHFTCPCCGKTFIIQMTDRVFENNWKGKKLEKCCSMSCAQKLCQKNRDNSKYQTEEYRQKLRDSWVKRKEKGLSALNTGKHWKWTKGGHSEETKRKLSESTKDRWDKTRKT